ncbi:hypothetical protein D3C81_2318790 [compost metagenome]
MQPRTGNGRQAGDGPHIHAAIVMMLQAVTDTDKAGLGSTVHPGQLVQILLRDSRNG